ncbi:PSP1 C-terminal conserved region-domain-containing protein [Lobosporangium transversale]|uniref:PSP1 C-terminal conserved region-domain-containing protein n=1 Tax=Lobosporangium transversale TaxID=64571 RepID=A0A1Y2G9L8_9FUNG|nr:PSP1 C-terminal conserved region-domain-containing protein [Lobosporangium transversale]ORY95984.1 PSP1 C-terminal conserved region-domain-containing protein [Lobosporangium transversale]|eukprot:XP_021875425.1 PSP1 C-terminal conserved region-domain-containing protein [Lobosporangium transversale]
MGSNDLGKGVTLSQLSHYGALYLVEFKAGRSDLFYVADGSNMTFKCGDLVMVEADRGKDLGKITNDSITPSQIQALQKEQTEAAAMGAQQEGQRTSKELHPKRIFRPALPSEIAQLANKNQDEIKAMLVCQNRVRQKKLPMEVVDAEYQWDRRKLTFYFRAEHRIDFRELVRDLFKIYKTRIWMYAVSPSKATLNNRDVGMQMSTPHTQTSPLVSSSPPQSLQSIQRQNHSISLTSTHPHGHNPHQQQYPHHHPAQYHQLQAQDQMLQMQSHYFSAPPQQMFYHGFQNDRPLLDDGSSHLPLYDPTYPLQSPHPLM